MTANSNGESLVQFEQFVQELQRSIRRQYGRNINKDLSQQQWRDLFLRNVTASLRQAYGEALDRLRQLPFQPGAPEAVLQVFDGFIDAFVQYALQKHRTSCALSNFPDEHQPSRDYIAAVLQEADKDWQAFAGQVTAELF
ncbi:MAG: amine oxidase [Gammaproteobacteria bacterium]